MKYSNFKILKEVDGVMFAEVDETETIKQGFFEKPKEVTRRIQVFKEKIEKDINWRLARRGLWRSLDNGGNFLAKEGSGPMSFYYCPIDRLEKEFKNKIYLEEKRKLLDGLINPSSDTVL